jgi:hypothetical protein
VNDTSPEPTLAELELREALYEAMDGNLRMSRRRELLAAYRDAILASVPEPAAAAVPVPAADQATAYQLAADTIRDTIAPSDWPNDSISIWNTATNIAEHRLRRLAVEAAAGRVAADTPPAETCAHCGQPVRLITGTLAAWWVHDPGGNTICDPQQAASSPRATPAVLAQPGKEA